MTNSNKRKVNTKVSENEIIQKIDSINLKEVKDASASMNYYTNFLSLKFKKNREGIIYSMQRMKYLEGILKKLNKELLEGNKELEKLEKCIKDSDKVNTYLQKEIKKEIDKGNMYKSRVSLLKKNKIRIIKAQDILDQDIYYMESRINMMKQNADVNNKKVRKILNDKDKMHEEMEKFKKERKSLQYHLNNTKQDHEVLKNKMQNFILNMKKSKTEDEKLIIRNISSS
ncbi:conserved Plasmodium protein, unknown function [Plasmodium gallinaceum]|uniref:Uncharacterized protein n=1 Tax=Plasmodium gallinaceum TaxID=5849 RepID=A0A1J1GZX7_PLAGA|nr:conserved Plasmodium protein, unknown function [Plasmodium gallinaceum]CRG98174.1 conserved Plasmodium protein, unknown function [Plasmodium gallinaceum]